jgi:branched-chain amino acid transport system ATP-binding protein
MSLLKITNASTGYGNKQVLFDVSLDVEKGDAVLLIGSNGSGKSTLLKLVYGLMDIWQGTVEYNGQLLHSTAMKTPTHRLIDKGIQYVPQKNELFDDASVMENLQYSLLHLNNRKESLRRIDEVMTQIPILKDRRKQLAGRLSGGERKMLSLGMVLVNRPTLLLYDEPLAGLSEDNIPLMLEMLGKIRQKGTTMVVAEHRVMDFASFADYILGLRLGYVSKDRIDSIDNIQNYLV